MKSGIILYMNNYREVAVAAVLEAGDKLVELSDNPVEFTMKGARDIQAQADLDSEQIIIGAIAKAFPTHGILSEEAGEAGKKAEYRWAVDPLDGTVNFAKGIDQYAVSAALDYNNETILGVIYQPKSRLLFVAEKGAGAYLNDHRLEVSEEGELANCLAATDTTSNYRKDNFDILTVVANNVRQVRIFGSSALHLAKVAQGQLDFYYKAHYSHWDYAAGVLMVQEAGGVVTDLAGQPIRRNSRNILAGGSAIHQAAIELIKGSMQKS